MVCCGAHTRDQNFEIIQKIFLLCFKFYVQSLNSETCLLFFEVIELHCGNPQATVRSLKFLVSRL